MPPASTTPRRAPARVALQTRAVAHQGKIPALAAGLALVARNARLGAVFGGGLGVGACVAPLSVSRTWEHVLQSK
jgi:hypothetical protein